MSEAEDWAGALLESKGLEQLQDYLIRGRALSNVSTEELSSRWVAWLNAWADGDRSQFREYEDIEAEMKLRNVKPPRERMPAAAAQRFKKRHKGPLSFFATTPKK